MDIRYVAGLFDGEGTIGIRKYQCPKHLRYTLHVAINMTDPRPLIELKNQFGGSFVWCCPRKKANHRQCYSWTTGSKNARQFLEQLLPYLIIKREEAEWALEFQSGIWHRTGRGDRCLPREEYARREELRRKITDLKHKTYDPADFGMVANSGDTQNGQSRAKQRGRPRRAGVCNEPTPPSTEKMGSDLRGNTQSAAEMTAPRGA